MWNPHIISNTKIIIPPVSICDEIKMIGFGMTGIKLLCLSGILIEQISQKGNKKWFLAPNYKTWKMFLFVDELSLDCFCHLVKTLTNLPLSFGPAFQQGLIFQKAMEQIVEVNGTLHMVFHILQTIYTVYKPFMLWCIDVIKWERIKISQI